MKHIFLLSIIIVAMLLQSCGVTRRMASREALSCTPSQIDLVVDQSGFPYTVDVNFRVNIPRGYVTTCSQLVITPYFTDGVHTLQLTPLFVNGRTFNRIEQRRARLGGAARDYTGSVQFTAQRGVMAIELDETVDFQPWMVNSDLILATSCVSCDRVNVMTQTLLAQGMQYFPPSLGPAIMPQPKPKPEPFISKEQWSGQLAYRINNYEIIPDFNGNAAELSTLNSLVRRIMSDSTLHVVRIVACGVASPDGVADQNKLLAQERANSLKNYLVSKLGIPPSAIESAFVAEDWDGLRDMMSKSSLTGAQQFVDALDAVTTDQQREKVLRQSPLYPYMRVHILPKLRKVTCNIYYTKVN